jgi:glycerol-3-phosphate dehydrogenase
MNSSVVINSNHYDLLIVGGGINGTGIAASAAERGLKVFLCEQNDLASATSSASSKLIHGGLRYLEHYEFRLVRDALAEREILMQKAPHLVWPQEFILPHSRQLRPAWMIRSGLFLYDHLSPRSQIPASRKVTLAADNITKDQFKTGFSYYDCSVDDTRLVISNALAAKAHQADIRPQTKCIGAQADESGWQLTLQDAKTTETYTVNGACLVNAAGPWAQSFFDSSLGIPSPRSIRLIKGSHILVPRSYTGDQAYILQNPDRRIIFVIPYLGEFSLIGTTDVLYDGDPAEVKISTEEIQYLLDSVNRYFRKSLTSSDVIADYSGVRPLCDDESGDPSAMTRDYTLELQEVVQQPLLSVFGGKITTFRRLAESAIEKLAPYFPDLAPPLPSNSPLPGGEFSRSEWPELLNRISQQAPFLKPETQLRLARSYGLNALKILEPINNVDELGQDFGCGLYEREVDYLVENEWAVSAKDILWRRSKLGYFLSSEEKSQLESYLAHR